jgi:phospholipid N-methyltransferase
MPHTLNRTAAPAVSLTTSFLKQFLLKPSEVGSLIPSSRWLAASMLKGLDISAFKTVIEYGPGSGSFTSYLYPRLGDATQFIAVEPNSSFAAQIQQQFPKSVVARDYADKVGFYLGGSRGEVDLVVSGLPFSLMDWSIVEKTISETAAILKPGGHFRTFTYCHMNFHWKIRKLRQLLEDRFTSTTYSVEMRNFPPAVVIECVK